MLKALCLSLIIIAIPIYVLAQDSYAIRISCVIPEIPGVNVPLIKDNNAKQAVEEQKSHDESNSGSGAVYENDREETRIVKGEAITITVKTIYSR